MQSNNRELLHTIVRELKAAYEVSVNDISLETYEKSEYDVVTNVDYSVEQYLMDRIREIEPDAVFLSEEYNPQTAMQGRVWIIDPIDGTCNFSHGMDLFGVQCALFDRGEVQLSVIYLPFRDECFTALRGEGAWLNGESLRPQTRSPEKSIISFGDFIHKSPELMEIEHAAMKRIASRVERIRMVGAASIDFAYCAAGRFDGNVTFTDNKWDIMPGLLLCKEAGLIVTDVFGEKYTGQNQTVAVFATEALKDVCIIGKFKYK